MEIFKDAQLVLSTFRYLLDTFVYFIVIWKILRLSPSKICYAMWGMIQSLQFSEAPLINLSSAINYYTEGSPVTIACGASGKPLPDVAWIRNGVLESAGKKAALLKFDNINRMDAGQYTCQANNSVEVTSFNTTIVVYCKYILTLIFNFWIDFILQWDLCYWGQLHKIDKSVQNFEETEFHLKSFFRFVSIGPKYWLGQLNLGGIIAHILLRMRTWQFFYQVIVSGDLEKSLRPFPRHCDNPRFTPFFYHTRLVLCEGSGWGLIESRELVKTLTR